MAQIMENTAGGGEKEVQCVTIGGWKWFYIEERENDSVKRGLSETGSCRAITGWLAFCI